MNLVPSHWHLMEKPKRTFWPTQCSLTALKKRRSILYRRVTSQPSGHLGVSAHRLVFFPKAGRGKGKRLGGDKLAGQLLPLRPAGTVNPTPRAQPALPESLPTSTGRRDAWAPRNSLLWRSTDSPPLTSRKEGYCLEPISSHLSAWMLSASRLCRAPHISLQSIKLRQKKETYLALRMCVVSFFCLNLWLFNELNVHWLN